MSLDYDFYPSWHGWSNLFSRLYIALNPVLGY
jgi:hypothetical protein